MGSAQSHDGRPRRDFRGLQGTGRGGTGHRKLSEGVLSSCLVSEMLGDSKVEYMQLLGVFFLKALSA